MASQPDHVRTGRPIGVTMGTVVFLLIGLAQTGGLASPFGLWFFLGWAPPPASCSDRPGVRSRSKIPRPGSGVGSSDVSLDWEHDPQRGIVVVAGGATMMSLIYVWVAGDTFVRFSMLVVFVMIGLIAIFIWIFDG